MTAIPAVPPSPGARTASAHRRRGVLRAVVAVVIASTAVAACDSGGSAGAKNSEAPNRGSAPSSEASPSPKPKAALLPPHVVPAWNSPPENESRTGNAGANGNKGQDVPRDDALGTWQVGSTLFVGRGTAMKMFDMQTGKELGSVAPPGRGMKPCAMTEAVNKDGIGAIAWTVYDDGSSDGACKKLSFVDARNGGKVLRTTEFAGKKRKDGSPWFYYESRIGFVGEDIVAALTPTSVVAFRVDDGSTAWTWENRSKDPSVFPNTVQIAPVVNTAMKTGPDVVAVISDASQSGGGYDLELVTLDAAGRQIGAQPTPFEGPVPDTNAEIVSAAPITVMFAPDLGDELPPQLLRFDRDGTQVASFPLAAQQGPVDYQGSRTLHGQVLLPYRVSGDTLYGMTRRDPFSSEGRPGVVAFDLSSGELRWEVPSADMDKLVLVEADKDGLVAVNASYDRVRVESYAAADGQVTVLSEASPLNMQFPVSTDSIITIADGRMLVTRITPIGYGTQAFAAP
ncbi:hypothetical protein [Streptodolium elevatio]